MGDVSASDFAFNPAGGETTAFVDEMETSYLSYAMSVILSRSLPDVRDGLKPVHRRILFMASQGYKASGPFRKSAKLVGDVMGRLHPHGDSSIYDAMVRMGQPWNNSLTLIEGQGNFGSIDGDKPAAMRYTETRMSRAAHHLTEDLGDLNPKRLDMRPTYDDSELEPAVLPARYPNLLVNGTSGIAVGMASNIPTHNLGEVIDATLAMMANPDISLDEVMTHIPGPDFPGGGTVFGQRLIRQAYETGRCSVPVCGDYAVEPRKGNRESVVITALPYGVIKTRVLEQVAELVKQGNLAGVTDVRDESDRKAMRIVVDVRADADATLIMNLMRKSTSIDESFGINMVCCNGTRPMRMGLMDILRAFIDFRRRTVFDRSEYLVGKLRDTLMTEVAIYVASQGIDEVIRRIRASKTADDAVASLMEMRFETSGRLGELLKMVEPDEDVPDVYALSREQAVAITQKRLRFLAAVEQEKVDATIQSLLGDIGFHERVMTEQDFADGLIRDEMTAIREAHAVPRRTRIMVAERELMTQDDLVEEKQVILTLTARNYVKITPVDAYREQARGGKGRSGMETKSDDLVVKTLVCSNKDNLLLFTNTGKVHRLKAYQIREAPPNARGVPMVQYLSELRPADGEFITTLMVQPRNEEMSLLFVTSKGDVRRSPISAFETINRNGKMAIRLDDTTTLVDVVAATAHDDLVIYTSNARAIRFPVDSLRVFAGRESAGVRGIRLPNKGCVIGAAAIPHCDATPQERYAYAAHNHCHQWEDENGQTHEVTLTAERLDYMRSCESLILTVTEGGFGKRFSSHELRVSARDGQGVEIGSYGNVTGRLLSCAVVAAGDSVTLATTEGQLIRIGGDDIRKTRRTGRGVILFDIPKSAKLVGVAVVPAEASLTGEPEGVL